MQTYEITIKEALMQGATSTEAYTVHGSDMLSSELEAIRAMGEDVESIAVREVAPGTRLHSWKVVG
jgi:hypothetical protein